MDPSGFNLNRIGNAFKSKENARNPKFRGPHYILTTIIVMVVLAGGLFLLFHQPAPKHQMNWTILSTVPASQSKQVEDTSRQTIPDGFLVPTKLPFRVQSANATNSTSNGSLQIWFINGKDAVIETIANGLETSSPQLKDVKQINLPHSDSAYTATKKGILLLAWTKNGNTYSLSSNQWSTGASLNLVQLITIYKSMA